MQSFIIKLTLILGLCFTFNFAGDSKVEGLPNFSITDLEGKAVSSSAWKGKYVIVDVWATWCTTCRNVINNLKELQPKIDTSKVLIVGVSTDKGNSDKVKQFVKKTGINYLILHDKDNALVNILNYTAVPSLFVFSPEGKLLYHMDGYVEDQEAKIFAELKKRLGLKS